MTQELRPYWQKFFNFNWKFGLFLILLICVPRFLLVLHANATANYGFIGMIMAVSAIAPFVFLSKHGRRKIGIVKPKNHNWLLLAFIAGIAASILLHYLGKSLYDHTHQNWYHYIARSYNIPQQINGQDKMILFSIMALTGMTFSPIGEELFFRGIVHSSFENSVGKKEASLADSSAFALTHISHFGLVYINNQWKFLTTPSVIWVLSMFMASIIFFLFKQISGSILGAIVCHAGFNLGMIYSIFYLL